MGTDASDSAVVLQSASNSLLNPTLNSDSSPFKLSTSTNYKDSTTAPTNTFRQTLSLHIATYKFEIRFPEISCQRNSRTHGSKIYIISTLKQRERKLLPWIKDLDSFITKSTPKIYEKSFLVAQAFNDKIKVSTQAATVQCASQRIQLSLSDSDPDFRMSSCDMSQVYVQSFTKIKRPVLVKPPNSFGYTWSVFILGQLSLTWTL